MKGKPLDATLPPPLPKAGSAPPTKAAPAPSNGTWTPPAPGLTPVIPASVSSASLGATLAPAVDALTGEPVPPVPAPIAIPDAPVDNSPQDTTPVMTADVPKVQLPDGSWVPAPNPGPTPEQLANNPSDLRNKPEVADKVKDEVDDAKAWIKEGEPAEWPKRAEAVDPSDHAPTPLTVVAEMKPVEPGIIESGPTDVRALWDCVKPEGPRTGCRHFRSDDHLIGLRIQCPSCRGTTVIRVEEP